MAGRRRGRTGRGWDASPARAPRAGDAASGRVQRRPTKSQAEESAPTDQAELAREICLRQLATRPRTRAELATVLRRRGIDDEVAAEVLDRYHEVGMVNDA